MTGLDLDLEVTGRVAAALTAEPGEVVGVIGPNGAGKSSLVAALAGLLAARGHARLGGTELLTLAARDRHVGLVFQQRLLFPHLSALDNVAFGPRARGVERRAARAAAGEWLDRLGVGELAHRRPGELSGGQAQRVAIARALVTEPGLLLLDEPMAGLDVGVAAALRVELARHLESFGGITLLVTHDALDALTLATQVVVLEDGVVAQQGVPAEVAARPRTEHVARMVGLNVLREDDAFRAFRPAAVTVSLRRPEGSARNLWRGRVHHLAPHGDAIRVQVTGERDLIADVTPTACTELGLTPGREVWLSVKETAVETYASGRAGVTRPPLG